MSSSFNQPKVDELIVVTVHSKIQDSCNPAILEFHATFRRTLVPQNMVSAQRHSPCAIPHWYITCITSSFRALKKLVEAIWPTTFHPHCLPSSASAFPGRTLMGHWCITICILVCIHRCWLAVPPTVGIPWAVRARRASLAIFAPFVLSSWSCSRAMEVKWVSYYS